MPERDIVVIDGKIESVRDSLGGALTNELVPWDERDGGRR
jgi:hypothetical protein